MLWGRRSERLTMASQTNLRMTAKYPDDPGEDGDFYCYNITKFSTIPNFQA